MTACLAHPAACAISPTARAAAAVLIVFVIAGCGSQRASVLPPDGPAQGSLLVLEARPCNWLQPPDPNRCDAVGLARIGLDGELLEELTPELWLPGHKTARQAAARRPAAPASTGGGQRTTWPWLLGPPDRTGRALGRDSTSNRTLAFLALRTTNSGPPPEWVHEVGQPGTSR